MADWNDPGLSSAYVDFLADLKARDEDAASLGYGTITNPVTGQLKYVRASDKFQEWDGGAWVDKNLSIAGGGTGAATASNARTNLGLGTMAVQAASGVAITGGTITGLGSLAVNGDATLSGLLKTGSTPITLTNAAGKLVGIDSTRFASLDGSVLTALNGSNISSGQVAVARLGTGSPSSSTFLRGDGSWAVVTVSPTVSHKKVTMTAGNVAVIDSVSVANVEKTYLIVSGTPDVNVASSGTLLATISGYLSDSSGNRVTSGTCSGVTFRTNGTAQVDVDIYYQIVAWP